jgi:hypothetical protein
MKRLVPIAFVGLLLAACGSSGGGSSDSSTDSQRADIQACLKKHGIVAPRQRPPQGGPPQGGPPQGGPPMSGLGGGGGNSKVRKALKDCGIDVPNGARRGPRNGAQFRQSIEAFVSCVRRNGFNLPDPDLSGKGPVFDPAKVNQNDPKFVAASRKCRSALGQRGGQS